MKKSDFLFLLMSSTILVIAWILFTVLHNQTTSTISEGTNQQIAPITPTFNTDTISLLKSRQNIQPVYTLNTPATASSGSATPTPTPTPVPNIVLPLASGSAQSTTSGGKQ